MSFVARLAISCIRFYQVVLSPDTGLPRKLGLSRGNVCMFTPSCSEYAAQAIGKYGVLKGSGLGAKRIARCNPFATDHFDPVP